ncbi:MAG: serine hydrolase, partial [Caulobacteraceae bacterium]
SDAFLIVQNGRLVFERYGQGHGPATRHIAWSMTKSVTQALAGVAVAQGKVDIDRPLKTAPGANPKLTLRALLTLTDGLKWDEADYDPARSDATKMLYGPGRLDGAAYAAAKPQAFPPGTHWNYSTGAFQLAAAELQMNLFPDARTPTARRATMAAWMRHGLFDPIGMASAVPEFDAAGTFVGGSFLYATARDFARFGELYRLDGVWKGHRILPNGWVEFARTPTIQPAYGAGFWLEAKAGNSPASLLGGAGPMDTFSAQGHEGQVIAIVPSKALVVVRLGLMPDDDPVWKAFAEWLTPVIDALPDTKPALG